MRILLVDDDEVLTQTLVKNLATQHYAVDVAADGEAGWDYTQAASYDLIVLDVNLPKLNGISLCQKLRQNGYREPILLLTSQGGSSDKVMGLDAGADDYVVKPCTLEELCARMRALLRRHQAPASPVLEWGHLHLDPSSCEVTYQGQPLSLSPKEYSLLELFLRNPQRIFNSSLILEHLWGFAEFPGEETVRAHIKRLRRKLKAAGAEEVIDTVYGMGYRLKPMAGKLPASPASAAQQVREAAIAAWEQFKQPMLERLAVVDRAVTALQSGTLPEELRQAAEGAAHKLAGSLGMFGFPEGSRLGRLIEQWLQTTHPTQEVSQLQSLVAELHQVLQQQPQLARDKELTDVEAAISQPQATLRLLVVEDDVTVRQQFQKEAANYGIQVEVAADIATAKTAIAKQLPDAVLLALAFPNEPCARLGFLDELIAQFPHLPVLVLTVHDGFSDRLEIIRRGGWRVMSQSTPPDRVLKVVREVLLRHRTTEIKVLVVDDDPAVLEALKQCLAPWGIHLITLDDPRQCWETLATTMPDLLILDIDMPYINGIELCQVIRGDSYWGDLPILFLSSHRDAETVYRIYSAGADDYVAKPFTEPEMVARIFNRLERHRLLQSLGR